jgi:flagellar hook-basal body complex protein FliE
MSEIRILPVGSPGGILPKLGAGPVDSTGFGDLLRRAVGQVNQLQKAADTATQEFSVGHTQDVASTLIAIEKANLGFQLTLQIRNKLLEAYQEIMRTSV